MGERIGVLRDGKIVQVGTPDDLYESPDDTFVAGMVGSPQMNLIGATRRGSTSNPTVEVSFGEFDHADWRQSLGAFDAGESLMFGVRPHDIQPVDASDNFAGPTFDSQIHLTEPLGDVVILDLIANGARLKMVLPEEQAVTYDVGDRLTCGFNLEATHIFATETGTAIR
jgi:multiple sugar transport system ATP-binding protein